jgi:hypothetical protein
MILSLLIILLFTPASALAQDASISAQTATPSATSIPTPTPDPNIALFLQYQTDYLFQRDQYQSAYLDYTQKKEVYTKYGTITTQKDKIEATKVALISRNNMMRAYTIALRTKLNINKFIDPTDTEKVQIELSKWESWYDEQNSVIPALNNESDISKSSRDFQKKLISIQQFWYIALVQNEANLRLITLGDIQQLATTIQTSLQQSQPEVQQWLTSLPIKSDLVNTSLSNAINLTTRQQDQTKFSNFYPSSKSELSKSNSYLLEMNNNLKSIITKFGSTN